MKNNAFYILGRDAFKYYPLIHCNDSPKFELQVPEYKQSCETCFLVVVDMLKVYQFIT